MYFLSIPQQLDTLLSNLVKANLSEDEIQECKKASMNISQINMNLHDNQIIILGSKFKIHGICKYEHFYDDKFETGTNFSQSHMF